MECDNIFVDSYSKIINKKLLEYQQTLTKPIEPKHICIDSFANYNDEMHNNMLIEFRPGGKVGDDEWQFQHMHNARVIIQYTNNQKKYENIENIFYAPETYIKKSDVKNIKSIHICYDDILIDKIEISFLEMAQYFFDIKPTNDDDILFIKLPDNYDKFDIFAISNNNEKIYIDIFVHFY
jgi:hypothetical protein